MPSVSGRLVAAGLGAVLVAGTGAYVVWSRRRRSEDEQVPEQWRQVGVIRELYVFPLKSGAPVAMPQLEATELGMRSGALRDRMLTAVDGSGRFVSARIFPRLELVTLSVEGDILTLSCRDDESFGTVSIDLAKAAQGKHLKIRVWNSVITAVDCGDDAASWIRRAVGTAGEGDAGAGATLRLAYYPKQFSDRGRDGNVNDLGLYSDQTSYNLLSEASLGDLNKRLERPVTVRNFRPNFLVEGPKAYEEDTWTWVRIGTAVFKVLEPCTRCIMVTVDPSTGMKSQDMEPLKTLKSYRQTDGEMRKKNGDSPMFAVRMGIRLVGNVAVGDGVYVPC